MNGLDIFYREGGPSDAPTLVLLHGFPAASHQYARLMDRLSDRVHVIALDYPGFGYSASPTSSNDGGDFTYTFDHLADVTEAFLTALGVNRFFMYVFDFGAPVGYRIASRHPNQILGVVAQNGNAYEVGLGPNMQPARQYWADRTGLEDAIRKVLTLEATRDQHLEVHNVDPEAYKPMLAMEKYIHAGTLGEPLLALVKIRASQINGCAWCLDMHYKEARKEQVPQRKLDVIAGWSEAPVVYSERERAALALTEEVTLIRVAGVSDAVWSKVTDAFQESDAWMRCTATKIATRITPPNVTTAWPTPLGALQVTARPPTAAPAGAR